MRQTYEYFIALAGGKANPETASAMEKIGWEVYEREVAYQEGAEKLLTSLQGKVRLFLLTQGDPKTQKQRLDRSGVLVYFEDFRIVPSKRQDEYLSFIKDNNIDVSRSWMVGNSLRADINPALGVGLAAAHYKIPAWEFEHEEPSGFYYTLNNLIDFLELIEL